MGSLACHSVSAVDLAQAGDALPPELAELAYCREVLQLAVDKSEAMAEGELLARATALGLPPSQVPAAEKRNTSSAESNSTVATSHVRTFSNASNGSASTVLTAHSSIFDSPIPHTTASAVIAPRRRSKSLAFSHYDKYLQHIDPNINQPKFLKEPPPEPADTSGQSVFSVSTRKSYLSIKRGIKNSMRWRRKKSATRAKDMCVDSGLKQNIRNLCLLTRSSRSCVCCRDDFDKTSALQNLPCGHTYCGECLRVMINQATTDESKMPPRCCTQPIPGSIVKNLLAREEQHLFLKAVLQFSTPWESRIFCPNAENLYLHAPRSTRSTPLMWGAESAAGKSVLCAREMLTRWARTALRIGNWTRSSRWERSQAGGDATSVGLWSNSLRVARI